MPSNEIKHIFQQQISQYNHCLLSTITHKQHHKTDIKQIVQGALELRRQNKELQLLCFVSYMENNIYYTKYQIAYTVQQILLRKKRGAEIKELFIEFLCLYKKALYEFEEVIEVVVSHTRDMYAKDLDNQVERNLYLIPPHAVMRNGKKYCEEHPEVLGENTPYQQPKTIQHEEVKQQPKKTKTQNTMPRKNDPKVESKKQQVVKKPALVQKNTKKEEKKQLQSKKLCIQSGSQSQDYYRPDKPIQGLQIKKFSTNPSMQLQNQGNYMENKIHAVEKMEIEVNESRKQKNHKQASPKQTKHAEQSQDQMDDLLEEMKKKNAQEKASKQSIGAKSLPAPKQTKLGEFCSKMQPPKSVATKQGSLFGWMGNKA